MNTLQEVQNKLNSLIQSDKLSIETLSIVTKIDKKFLSDFLEGAPIVFSTNDDEQYRMVSRIIQIAYMLSDGMELIQDDDRVKGIIDVLKETYKMEYKAISQYAGISEEQLCGFMDNPNYIPYEIRYKLAVRVSILNYIFKSEPRPKDVV